MHKDNILSYVIIILHKMKIEKDTYVYQMVITIHMNQTVHNNILHQVLPLLQIYNQTLKEHGQTQNQELHKAKQKIHVNKEEQQFIINP